MLKVGSLFFFEVVYDANKLNSLREGKKKSLKVWHNISWDYFKFLWPSANADDVIAAHSAKGGIT